MSETPAIDFYADQLVVRNRIIENLRAQLAASQAHAKASDDFLKSANSYSLELEKTCDWLRRNNESCTDESTEIALRADVARYRAALAPFALLLQDHNNSGKDERPIFGINDVTITLGDLRVARKALAADAGPPNE